MKKIRNLLLSVCLGTAVFVLTPSVQADNTNTLVDIVKQSVTQSYIQAESQGVLSLDENELVLQSTYTKNADKIKQKASLDLHVQADTLPEAILVELDGLSADFSLDINTLVSVFYNKYNQDIFYEIGDFNVDVNSQNADTKNIIEGFFEITKMFTGETYYINLKKLADEYESFTEDFAELDGMNMIDFDGSDAALVLELILKSGFLDIELNNNVYTISLKSEIEEINRQEIIEILTTMNFLPMDLKTDIINELSNAITEDDYAMINEGLKEVQKYFDFKVTIEVKNEFVSVVNFDWNVNLSAIFGENGSDIEVADLKYVQSANFEYSKSAFSFPKEDSTQISFNKIMGLFLTFEKQAEERWANYEDEAYSTTETVAVDDWSYSDNDKTSEVLEAVSAKFGEDVWFMPYVKDLVEREVLSSFYDPERSISGFEFRDLLDSTIYSSDYYYNYSLDDTVWHELSTYENLSKLDAVTYIVNTFFPEETNPTMFARESGIVSKSFSVTKAREEKLMLVELVKMLSVAVELADNQ